jgi:hypothetical protein
VFGPVARWMSALGLILYWVDFAKEKKKKSGKKKQQGKKESLIYEPLLVMQLYTLQFTRIELILMVSDLPILNYNNSLFIL